MISEAGAAIAVAAVTAVWLPWVVFVTLNIFALKQQVALLKQELDVLQEIRQILIGLANKRPQ